VQAGNADEMRNSRAIENAPLLFGNGALIADGEGDDDAGVFLVW
jgi:hypothetical protein